MAVDSGIIWFEQPLDATGANSVALGLSLELSDVIEVGFVFLTAGTVTAAAVEFHDQTTASATAPTAGSATLFATVTSPNATTSQAAGQGVQKFVPNKRLAKYDRLWAVVKTTTTGATNMRVYARVAPAGQSAAEPKTTNSTT